MDLLAGLGLAYDRLAAVWSSTTDKGPFNGFLERPALRALVPGDLHGTTVLDAGCGSGAQAQWLLEQGADIKTVQASRRPQRELDSGLPSLWHRPYQGISPGIGCAVTVAA